MKKKMFSLLLAVSMIASTGLAAVPASAAEATDEVLKDGEMTELLMVWPGGNASPTDMQEVQDAFNEEIQKYVDAEVTFQIIEWGSFEDQLNLMLSGGEKLDLFLTATNIQERGKRGQLYNIADIAETYAPDAYATMEDYIKACYFNGELYGFPGFRDMAEQAGLMCRTDILEETGYKAEDIKTMDDVDALLAKVKELYPDMYDLVPSASGGCLLYYTRGMFDIITSGVGVRVTDEPSDTVEIINTYATDEYMEMAERAYDWNQKGYFLPDATTNTITRQDLLKAGNTFGYIGTYHPGIVTQEAINSGREITAIPFAETCIDTDGVNCAQWLIPAQCENPAKALAVLNQLYSNPAVQNLFRYGIEGKDYEVKDAEKGIAGFPDGVDSSSVGWSNEMWLSGNASVGYAWETDPEDVFTKYAEFNDTARKSPLYGFVYDSSNVRNEITGISNVESKYKAIIENGDADPETTVAAFNEELKAAGIDTIIEDMQAQVDEWLAAQK